MCLLCVEIQKQKMTPREIARNFREVASKEHQEEVAALIAKDDDLFAKVVEELMEDQG